MKLLVLFLASLKMLPLEHRREGMDLLINILINIRYILSLFSSFLLNFLCKSFFKIKKKLLEIEVVHLDTFVQQTDFSCLEDNLKLC